MGTADILRRSNPRGCKNDVEKEMQGACSRQAAILGSFLIIYSSLGIMSGGRNDRGMAMFVDTVIGNVDADGDDEL